MSNKKYVQIEKDGIQGECLPSAVKTWEANGWTVVDDGDSENGSEVEPDAHTVTPDLGDEDKE